MALRIFGELITGEITIGRMSEHILLEHCIAQRSGDLNPAHLPRLARGQRFLPDATDTAQYLLPARGWRPYYNGVAFQVMLPINMGDETDRILGVFVEPEIARKVWGYSIDPAHKRGSCIIQNVGGRWYAICRFRKAGGRKRARHELGKDTLGLKHA
jgi:hypothetical protein